MKNVLFKFVTCKLLEKELYSKFGKIQRDNVSFGTRIELFKFMNIINVLLQGISFSSRVIYWITIERKVGIYNGKNCTTVI